MRRRKPREAHELDSLVFCSAPRKTRRERVPSRVSEAAREPLNVIAKIELLVPPREWFVQAAHVSAVGAKRGPGEKVNVVAESRVGRAEAGECRPFRMFHFFDSRRICSDAEPVGKPG